VSRILIRFYTDPNLDPAFYLNENLQFRSGTFGTVGTTEPVPTTRDVPMSGSLFCDATNLNYPDPNLDSAFGLNENLQ